MQFLTAISLPISQALDYWGALHARFTHADGRGREALFLQGSWQLSGSDKEWINQLPCEKEVPVRLNLAKSGADSPIVKYNRSSSDSRGVLR